MTGTASSLWLLLDDRAGNRSQCLGVAEALSVPYVIKDIEYSAWARLPNGFLGSTFRGLNSISKNTIIPPWPDLVISAGRRTGPVAREIKRRSNGHAKIVQIMWPGQQGIDAFDLVCVPNHDEISERKNVMHMTGAPNRVSAEEIRRLKERNGSLYDGLNSPRIALLCGGSTKNRRFTSVMASELGRISADLARACSGSLLVTTSRRTGDEVETLLQKINVPSRIHRWNDPDENPYMSYLAAADAIIVTGESMSMCSEACSTGKPVYIYAPEGLITDKHKRLHEELYRLGCARPLTGTFDTWSYTPLNTAQKIADRVTDLIPQLKQMRNPTDA